MNKTVLCGRTLQVVGYLAMMVGTLDPLEGSLLILPGSGFVALGSHLSGNNRRTVRYWIWTFALIAVGVSALFGLSAIGGIGGTSGHSMWWALLMVPYPVGWVMALAGGVAGLVRMFTGHAQRVHA